MSNALAIATVTATLAERIGGYVSASVPGAQVTTLPPGAASLQMGAPGVNIFVCAATPSTGDRGPPSRPAARSSASQPQAAFNLDYLITFFGDDTRLEPQRLMGAALAGLHSQPVLSPEEIQATIANVHWLAGSDLATQPAAVRIAAVGPTPGELAHLWSRLTGSAAYHLSAVYRAGPVLLDPPAAPH